jgi:hypothetical protein
MQNHAEIDYWKNDLEEVKQEHQWLGEKLKRTENRQDEIR